MRFWHIKIACQLNFIQFMISLAIQIGFLSGFYVTCNATYSDSVKSRVMEVLGTASSLPQQPM